MSPPIITGFLKLHSVFEELSPEAGTILQWMIMREVWEELEEEEHYVFKSLRLF